MNNKYTPAFLDALLKQMGGWYPLVVQVAAQLLSFGAAAIGILYILLNVNFTPEQTRSLTNVVFTLVGGANLILLVYMYNVSGDAQKRLYSWSKGKEQTENPELQIRAWQQITRYPWQFGIAAILIAVLETVLPASVFMYYIAGATVDQAIHVAIGGLLSAAMLVVSCVMMIEYGLLNARLALLPDQPELQKAGLRGTRLQTRLAVLVMSTIGVSILLVAPRSYQVAVDIMNGETISLYALRTELIFVATIAVAIGIVFTILISRIIYRPIAHLIEVMSDIERGNIQRRAEVLSTDEIGLATIQFNTMIERFENLQRRMDDEVQKRTWDLERKSSQLQAAAQVAREAAAIQDLYNLLNHSVNLISERFGFYHAGIFITDQSKQNVVLQAASSPGGQKMLERGHQLRVGGQGIVGAAAASGRPRIALDVGDDSVFFNNPDLPETHSEMALPLSVRGNLIGVLDIQSTETQAFSQDDLVILQTLADQIALAIENARLLFESQQAVRQLQISTGQSIRTGWQQYTSRRKHAYVYTPLSVQAFNKETSAPKQGQNVLEVPIKLRGQTIGNLSFQRASTENAWGEIEQSMTSEIASQIGLAIENARLIEEQLKLAERERQMNAIINEIRKSTSTDKVLQYTAREIGKALGAVRTFAQLGLPQQAEPDKNVNKQKTGSKSA